MAKVGTTRDLELIPTDSSAESQVASIRKAGRRANNLDGKSWTKNSISIWSDIKKTSEEINLGHPAIFPLQLATRVIECFSNDKDRIVLDPFAGVGTTVIAADRASKTGIGIELSKEFVEIAARRLGQRELFSEKTLSSEIYCADAHELMKYVSPQSVDLVVTSPPYWDILTQKRTADYKPTRHYGDESRDLGNIHDYNRFILALSDIFHLVYQALKPSKYCIVVVMDIRKKEKFYPFHFDLARALVDKLGFIFDDIIIWDRRHEYNNMRPLGYPSVFRINKAHEYILIFQKPNGA